MQRQRSPRGFSLVEILLTVGIFIVIGLGVVYFQRDTFQLSAGLQASLGQQQEARVTLKNILAELRSASDANDGSFVFADLQTSSITFYSDGDSDGLRERLRYFVSGTTLQRGMITPTGNPLSYNPANEIITTVVHRVQNGATPVLSYYDSSYDGTQQPLPLPVDPQAVRLVKVYLSLDQDPNRPPAPSIVTSQVSIRNLKSNL